MRLGKDASARGSMKTGGWTQAESYRDLIKDKDLAVSLEQQNRMALTGESLEQQIAETPTSGIRPNRRAWITRAGWARCMSRKRISKTRSPGSNMRRS